MFDKILEFYQKELTYLRQAGAEFGNRFPKIAGNLQMSNGKTEDPHVSRLIESFAFLTARISSKLEDDFPELSHTMLNILYPHFLAPLPSCLIAQLALDAGQTSAQVVPRHSEFEISREDGSTIPYRTCYAVTLRPIKIGHASMVTGPNRVPPRTDWASQTASSLCIHIDASNEEVSIPKLNIGELDVFISCQDHQIGVLMDSLLSKIVGIAVVVQRGATEPDDIVFKSSSQLELPAMTDDSAILELTSRSFPGYRLLTEFFAYPQTFRMFRLKDIFKGLAAVDAKQVQVWIYFSERLDEALNWISKSTFRLGSVPMVNTFERLIQPVEFQPLDYEQQIVVDEQRPDEFEILNVASVVASSKVDDRVEMVQPFFFAAPGVDEDADKCYWHMSRRGTELGDAVATGRTDIFLSFVNENFQRYSLKGFDVTVEAMCCNKFPMKGFVSALTQTQLTSKAGGPFSVLDVLAQPTKTVLPLAQKDGVWQLLAHVTTSNLSLFDARHGPRTLQTILRLYDRSETGKHWIEGIKQVACKPSVAPILTPHGIRPCKGLDVDIRVDPRLYVGTSLLIWASVLDAFLSAYVSVNAFVRLSVTDATGKVIRKWAPRSGTKQLI